MGLALVPGRREPTAFDVARVGEDMTSHIADIRDLDAVKAVFERYKQVVVFRMAAQPIVRVFIPRARRHVHDQRHGDGPRAGGGASDTVDEGSD